MQRRSTSRADRWPVLRRALTQCQASAGIRARMCSQCAVRRAIRSELSGPADRMRAVSYGRTLTLRPKSAGRTLARAAMLVALRDFGPLGARRSRAERDTAAGQRVAEALGSLRGLYTKLGQHLATPIDALSDEFRSHMHALHDSPARVAF